VLGVKCMRCEHQVGLLEVPNDSYNFNLYLNIVYKGFQIHKHMKYEMYKKKNKINYEKIE